MSAINTSSPITMFSYATIREFEPRQNRSPTVNVAFVLERVTFTGVIVAVGDDRVSLRTPAGRVDVVVGCAVISDELRGTITVGRDHLHLRDGHGSETYVPLAWVASVMPYRP